MREVIESEEVWEESGKSFECSFGANHGLVWNSSRVSGIYISCRREDGSNPVGPVRDAFFMEPIYLSMGIRLVHCLNAIDLDDFLAWLHILTTAWKKKGGIPGYCCRALSKEIQGMANLDGSGFPWGDCNTSTKEATEWCVERWLGVWNHL